MLLVLFMIEPFANGGLGWEEADAVAWNGTYSALLYVTPALGGFLADRFLGGRRAILLGAGLNAVGIACLLCQSETFLWLSLAFVAVGNGFFKPCITSFLGQLYAPGDSRRETAYQYLYQTVLLGVLGAGVVCGWLQPTYGFKAAFATASGATLLAGLLFLLIPSSDWPKDQADEGASSEKVSGSNKNLVVIAVLALITIFFFAAHTQGGGLMTVFIHRYTERSLFGWEIPTLWLTSLGTLFGVAFTPVLAGIWTRLSRGDREPSFMTKLALGIGSTGLAFLFMMGADMERTWLGVERASVFWLLGFHVSYIMGKLLVTPVLWSTAERLAPARIRYLVMGVMMGCISIGYFAGGRVGYLIGELPFEQIFLGISVACFSMMVLVFQLRKPVLLRADGNL